MCGRSFKQLIFCEACPSIVFEFSYADDEASHAASFRVEVSLTSVFRSLYILVLYDVSIECYMVICGK